METIKITCTEFHLIPCAFTSLQLCFDASTSHFGRQNNIHLANECIADTRALLLQAVNCTQNWRLQFSMKPRDGERATAGPFCITFLLQIQINVSRCFLQHIKMIIYVFDGKFSEINIICARTFSSIRFLFPFVGLGRRSACILRFCAERSHSIYNCLDQWPNGTKRRSIHWCFSFEIKTFFVEWNITYNEMSGDSSSRPVDWMQPLWHNYMYMNFQLKCAFD